MLSSTDKLGEVLKTARLEMGFTRDQLSELVGISPRYLMSIEHEGKKPSYDILFKLIRKLAINPDDIFFPERHDEHESERKQLEQMLKLCNKQELSIISATVYAFLKTK